MHFKNYYCQGEVGGGGGGAEVQFSYEIIWDSKVLMHLAFLSLRLRRAPRSFLAYYLQAQATFSFKKLFPLVNNVVKSLFPEPYHCSTEVYFKRKSTERRYGSIRFLLAS